MAAMSYLKAVEAGADVLDCAISTMANSSSQPADETMVAALDNTPFATGLDLEKLSEIAEYFKDVRKKYKIFDVATARWMSTCCAIRFPVG